MKQKDLQERLVSCKSLQLPTEHGSFSEILEFEDKTSRQVGKIKQAALETWASYWKNGGEVVVKPHTHAVNLDNKI